MTPEIDWTDRFWSKVSPEPNSGCWLWDGGADRFGYGGFNVGGRVDKAHRVAFRAMRGGIGFGLCVLHKCDVPACVNPDHLFLGTRAENMEDKVRKGRQSRTSLPGEQNPFSKLNVSSVHKIRAASAAGERNASIARRFGVTKTQIGNIVKRKQWAHV